MIDWMGRANAKFAKTPSTATAKTDESGVSAVSTVGSSRVFEKRAGGFVGFGGGSTGVLAKNAISNDACPGWPRHEDSDAPYCPWGPYITPAMLDAWRSELRSLVAELATLEGWTVEQRDYVANFVEHQSGLATLRTDITYFRDRLAATRAAAEQEARRRAQAWRGEGLDARHYCPGCDGSCVGTSKRCTSRSGGRSVPGRLPDRA
ncbi:hypothetical protein [Burkholderia pseudomallei]|uniref:hypothetical protein n=1 Tax=Burkholderia pseudomallei TaxID=28450 RepID=UPI00050F63A5|nr:hypothetical protein [Burkholderia pseudomallei]KGC58557.1 hypothetical protein DP56_1339 [Burkholderia pseudomallei]